MSANVSKKTEDFFAQYRLRKYSKGQVLILNGDQADYVYYLTEGKVKVYDVTYRGEEIVLNEFKPLAFFPMSLAINKVPNPYIYEAESDIEVRQAPAKEVVRFIKENPDVMLDLLSRVYAGIDGLTGRIFQLMSGSAKSRLLYEIVIECRRFGKKQPDDSFELSIKEADLASRAGLSRETVSREISKLREEGLLGQSGRAITVPGLAVIEQRLKMND